VATVIEASSNLISSFSEDSKGQRTLFAMNAIFLEKSKLFFVIQNSKKKYARKLIMNYARLKHTTN
jgi:uncharacterized pyridoxamine 5'-phosphate oxidase family protein